MRLLPAEALLNNTRRLCISPSSGNRPWMGDVTAFFVFRDTHGQGVQTALNTPPLSSQLSSPPASEMCSVQPSPFPETEPERHESLPIRSYHCPAKPECHGFPCVTSFQPAISHRLWKSSPLIRKGTLTFGIYHRPFPTGRQIAGVRAFNTAGVCQRNGQCRASARPERDWFCSRHCHKYV